MDNKRYTVYNFPVYMLPRIFSPTTTRQPTTPGKCAPYIDYLRGELIDFALFYAANNPQATTDDIQAAADKYNIIITSPKETAKAGRRLFDEWRESGAPLTSIGHGQLWHYIHSYADETELTTLRVYLALRSLATGNRETKTTLAMIFARMAGKGTPGGKIAPDLVQWNTRRMWEKLRAALAADFGVIFKPGAHRGIIFTIKADDG